MRALQHSTHLKVELAAGVICTGSKYILEHNGHGDIYPADSLQRLRGYMPDMSQSIPDPIKEAVEQVRREAYAAGWKAAFEAMSAALASIGDGMEPGVIVQPFVGPSLKSAESSASLPTVGTTPHYVYQAVQRKQGMTGAEVIAAVRADGHDVAEPQIRTALSRLEKRQLLANRHRKWFLK